MTPDEFVQKWADTSLGEKQSYQAHFMDLCRLVGHETPAGDGKTTAGKTFQFEPTVQTGQGGHGFADVWLQDHFAIEYKAPQKYKDLDAAYRQLLSYREALNNPPLLVVTDINNWEIHSNFPNTQKRVYRFTHADIAGDKRVLGWLNDLFHAPQRLNPRVNSEQVTREAADAFQVIADNMRDWDAEPQRIAFFLTKLVFCLFAEDIGLLPTAAASMDGIFTHIIEQSRRKPSVFQQYVRNLFVAMNNGGEVLMQDIPYFNGTLFQVVTVEELSAEALDGLAKAAALDWSDIEPSIFGTLFERSLDPSKRSQLGAHYTSREDILLIVEPVLMQPLRYHWETIQLKAAPIRERHDGAKTGRARTNARKQLLALRDDMLGRIRSTKVLDPACGSGNFLYVSLQLLMDMEKEVIHHALWQSFQLTTPEVHPRQMYGIEINPIAHALASIVVWIGYIQWRKNNGYAQAFAEPILEELADNIMRKDAILPDPPRSPHRDGGKAGPPRSPHRDGGKAGPPRSPHRDGGKADPDQAARRGEAVTRPQGVDWPAVDVIVGNPPFLGQSRKRGELGDDYVDNLFDFYDDSLPQSADLVCYWFEQARKQIETGKVKRAGLLATNSIRGGANREVLKRIKETGDIFMAWSDREWILDGAAVRVSMVGFDNGQETQKTLDGLPVTTINPDLTASVNVTDARALSDNKGICMWADKKGGPFDIPGDVARQMLAAKNKSGYSNSDVIFPRPNGIDVVRRPRDYWIIDFGVDPTLDEARRYELPFQHVETHVKPMRAKNRIRRVREKWWIHREPSADMRRAIGSLPRFIATSSVAKYRLFVWLQTPALPDNALYVFARDDDYFFGVLHSKLHEVWSLRMGTSLEDRPRYTPTTTFETFPFPWSPGSEDESHPAHAAISAAARQLHAERHAWQNPAMSTQSADEPPPDLSGGPRGVKDRTLTNLYNALQVWRGESDIKTKPAAADFAPRLDELHRALDRAVCAAYGWDYAVLDDEEEMLRRLLALNLERAG